MGLLKDKTILYVTHQVEFLPAADLILVSIKNTFLFASTTCMLVLLRICKITK
jgi:ABC-type transport system involved in cytochrome bd biosynthesis fused ATPase/permease subunit